MSSRRDGDRDPRGSDEDDDDSSNPQHDVALWLDRFLSASRVSDVESALEGLLASSRYHASNKRLRSDDWPSESVQALVQLLQTSQHNATDVDDSGCQLLALQVISTLLSGTDVDDDAWAGKLLLEHSIVAALVDVSCSTSLHASLLSKVLAIETLEILAKRRSTTKQAQTQLLQANGLVRLAELFSTSDSNSGATAGAGTAGPVSLAMLQLAQTIVEWPAVARNWMFVDVPTILLSTFVKQDMDDDNNTNNNSAVVLAAHASRVQALHVLTRMLQQDASFAVLLLETTPNLPVLLPCLDLRRAVQYRDPSLIPSQKKQKSAASAASEVVVKPSGDDDEDDLDALIQSASAKPKQPPPPLASASKEEPRVEVPPPPTLVEAEVRLIRAVMEFLEALLEQESVRASVWKKHEPMGRMLWDMALLTPPAPPPSENIASSGSALPPNKYYPCAMPPVTLQSDAFLHCATYWNNPTWLLPCLDRLLYLTCTGAGAMAQSLPERFQISQSAVHLLRHALTLEAAQDLLVSTKVGMGEDDEMAQQQQRRAPPTSVQKLVYTILEHLEGHARGDDSNKKDRRDARAVFLVGATTALLVVLHDNEASKSMLLSLEPRLMPKLLKMLEETAASTSTISGGNRLVVEVVLHFLARWIDGAPVAMQGFLQLPEASTVMAQLSGGSGKDGQSLVWVLLGLSLDQIMESNSSESEPRGDAGPGPSDATNQQDWGGWTASAIVDTFKSRGISRVIQDLQQYESSVPWVENCPPERRLYQDWYKQVVLRIRKRLIQAVLQQNAHDTEPLPGESESEEADRGAAAWSSLRSSSRSLSVLVQQQTTELEDLRTQLSDAKRTLSKQEQQLEAWRRRVESTPTQLDDMLSEYTTKTSDLVAQVAELKETLESTRLLQKQELDARDEQIANARKELDEMRDELTESRREKETMAEELKALSQAYSSLEEDYRRQPDRALSRGEGFPASQAQGEGSEESPLRDDSIVSTEVATLRADNARLKQDVKAAEDWMAMAYERMNAMQQETLALQTQVENAQLVGTASQSSEKTIELVLSDERSKRQQLEQELVDRKQHEVKLSDELEGERTLRARLESTLQQQSETAEQVSREKAELIATIEVLRRDLEASVATKGASDEPLQIELSNVQAELRELRERDQEEIYKLESKVRDLEARLGSGLGEFTIDDIRKRDEDIQQLQEANNAAQEWMTKAMEQNQVLASKVAELTQEKAEIVERARQFESKELASEIEDLRKVLGEAERRLEEQAEEAKVVISGWQEAYNVLEANRQEIEARLSDQTAQVAGYSDMGADAHAARVAELERVIEDLNRQLEGKEPSTESATIADLQASIEALTRQLSDQEEEARAAIEGWQQSYIEVESQLKDLQSQLESSSPADSPDADQVDETKRKLESITGELAAKDAELTEKASLLEDLHSTVVALQANLDRLQVERDESLVQVQMLKEQQGSQISRSSDLESAVTNLQQELKERDAKLQKASAQISEFENERSKLQQELKDQELEANQSIAGWQRSYEELMEKCNGLEAKIGECLTASDSDQSSRAELEARVADLLRQLEMMTTERMTLSEKETIISDLQLALSSQEREASEAIAGWQRSYEEAVQKCLGLEEKMAEMNASLESDQAIRADLEALIADLREQLESRDSENRVSELEAVVSDLEASLAAQKHEAEESIAGWQRSYDEAAGKSRDLEEKVAELLSKSGDDATARVELEILVADLRQQLESRDAELRRTSETEASLSNLQQQLAAQESEAVEAIAGWKLSYDEVVEKCRVLEEEAALEGETGTAYLRELETLVSDLQEQIGLKDAELSRLPDLESTVSELQQKLATQESDAIAAIAGWQRSYEDIVEKCRGLEQKVDMEIEGEKASRVELETLLADLRQQLETSNAEKERVPDLETTVAELQQKLVTKEREAIDSIGVLTAEAESLRIQLQEQEEEATNAISQWEDSYQTLESELSELKERVPLVEPDAFRELQDKFRILESDAGLLRETNESLAKTKSQLEAQLADLKESLRVANDAPPPSLDESSTNEELGEIREEMESLRHELTQLLADKAEEITRLTNESHSLLVQNRELDDKLQAVEHEKSGIISDLERTVTRLRSEMAEHDEHANEAIMQAQERLSEANAKNRALETEKWQLEGKLEAQAAEMSARVKDLEQTVENLQKELAEHDELANEAINQWQESLSDAEARIQDLDSANGNLRESVEDLESKLAASKAEIEAFRVGDSDDVKNFRARCKQLEDELSYLEDQAESYEGAIANRDRDLLELQRRIESSDDRIAALTDERDRLSSELDDMKSDLEAQSSKLADIDREHEAAVKELEGRLHNLTSTIQDLEAELESQALDAQAAISQWESSYLELQELMEGESRGAEGDATTSALQEEISFKRKLLALLMGESRGDSDLDFVSTDNLGKVHSDLCARLESAITMMKGELTESQASAVDLKSRLDEASATAKSLEAKCSASEQEAEESRQRVANLGLDLHDANTPTATKEGSDAELLRQRIDDLSREKSALEKEADVLKDLIRGLEDDVRVAEDMLRLHVANLDSDRAVGLVVETLQKENEELRSTVDACRTMLGAEKDARRAAEGEAQRLTSDLAAILGVHDSADYRPEIRMRAMQAREAIYRREEEEIEQLKDALTAALDELDVVRNVVHEAEERASKASIQASLYEQEIVTAKTDFKLLAEKMDEMRDAESTKREALETRVNSLQNECSALRRHHALALDKLQNDLNHANSEKDRLLQALKDSERSKDAMIRATTGERAPEGNDLFVELTKLRLEKAELLITASEEAAKFERRLREARAAEKATRDADTILERELRMAAEESLEATRRELAEMRIRSDVHLRDPTLGDLEEQMTLTELRRELARVQDELESLSGENEQLREDLEALRAQSREQLDALRDECRHAKARAAHLEREGRVEAEIQAEVARLRAKAELGGSNPSSPRSKKRSDGDDPAFDGIDDGFDENLGEVKRQENFGLTMKQMSAMIQEQDRRIKEGAAAYTTLAAEHDELLVVLAEVHNVRTSLKQALARTAGAGAVEEALRDAEAMTQSQKDGFGSVGSAGSVSSQSNV